ncbi:MAG: pyrroline-5-carboxylate reductase [delta proteobacterium ML8_F1]|nr:MAG: pyrroline-5-carboxylate reductase [delta proteobacterium ML8_F1]
MGLTIGFIGAGNMTKAIVSGLVSSKLFEPADILVSNPTQAKLEIFKTEYGVGTTTDNTALAMASDFIVLGVKPGVIPEVAHQLKDVPDLKSRVLITLAAGIPIAFYEEILGEDQPLVRTMPNTPAMVGEGMTAVWANSRVDEKNLQMVLRIFDALGKSLIIKESLFDAVTATSGSSPAMVYVFIEALADGAVLRGLPRETAYLLASQAVLGAAKMVRDSGLHPGVLKDSVTSPGGTTIEALKVLEDRGFRGSVMEAVNQCAEKSKQMALQFK